MNNVKDKILERKDMGRNHSVIVVSEGAHARGGGPVFASAPDGKKNLGGIGEQVAAAVHQMTQMETRVTVLGHLQRGGPPNASDKLLACSMGVRAVDLAAKGATGRFVAIQGGKLTDIAYESIEPHARRKIDGDHELLTTARALGIALGEASA